MHEVSNWGNYPRIRSNIFDFESKEQLFRLVQELPSFIPRGNGRCYGDSSLSENIVSTLKFNKILSFDKENGIMCCESGTLLSQILQTIVPAGWFLPVTPGTKFITLGGAVASDIHGKNHHKEGSFSNHVIAFDIMLPDGKILTCSGSENKDLFSATCGGMGLTGILLNITFRLKQIETAFIRKETVRARNLEELLSLLETSSGWTYTVSWIDCLAGGKNMGRGVLIRGEHAGKYELKNRSCMYPFRIPPKKKTNINFYFPEFILNLYTVRAFNFFYYSFHADKWKKNIVDYDSFFYPLDSVYKWNNIYGRRGFMQYQLVLPKTPQGKKGIEEILSLVSEKGKPSFLAVLKIFGLQTGMLSFPMEGYTLCLDFPFHKNLFSFLEELDNIVLSKGGRLYLTKDARMKKEIFLKTYPEAGNFVSLVRRIDPGTKIRSLQSERIGIHS